MCEETDMRFERVSFLLLLIKTFLFKKNLAGSTKQRC